ncbi:LOW QUALITY PROTEIN: hypothetical protein TorRG33x02_088100, partial [Trema orientale]
LWLHKRQSTQGFLWNIKLLPTILFWDGIKRSSHRSWGRKKLPRWCSYRHIAGGSKILYPSGNIASSSSSVKGRLLSSMSFSHLNKLYCSGVIERLGGSVRHHFIIHGVEVIVIVGDGNRGDVSVLIVTTIEIRIGSERIKRS